MKKKNSGISELTQITREKRKVQFYLNMLLGLSASCGVMIPTESIYSLLMELSAQEASLMQKAKDHSDYPE
ncbi:hypothetical protein [Paenibacillus riograndensis]|uniref:Uncharacterized protein n=2 Tax=Paenibacillus riograndensis TaxID=483937 RepID=A0A132TI60_9BACL|nr:hypothetical protein [Paenibacillus riograndensis]KWX70893.1 hypothetical protein AMQ84_28035 [Paenibacillus riograndensis]KWX88821.1 hypothetical protein AMQ83_04360 [Paenibacillus riograndensis]CQR55762.1 putative membrane protein [Paenibacillus riograndensis SBR5]